MEKLPLLGKILTHMAILTQALPNFIARSVYLLLGNLDYQIPKHIIKEDFMWIISHSERILIKKAELSFDTLEEFEKDLLGEFFISNKFFDIPKKCEIEEQIQTIAENVVITKNLDFIKALREGLPLICDTFWCALNVDKINYILSQQSATPNKVVKCLKTDLEDLTARQSTSLYYLKTFIRNLSNQELSKFLYFVTGSCNMPSHITVTFTNLSGSLRRPIVHTCSNFIEYN